MERSRKPGTWTGRISFNRRKSAFRRSFHIVRQPAPFIWIQGHSLNRPAGGLDIWDPAGGGVAMQEHFVTVRKVG